MMINIDSTTGVVNKIKSVLLHILYIYMRNLIKNYVIFIQSIPYITNPL